MKKILIIAVIGICASLGYILAGDNAVSAVNGAQVTPEDAKKIGYKPSASAAVAERTRQLLGERKVKDYHQKIHQNGTSCQLCHDGNTPTAPANDANCIRCHGTPEQMAKVTEKLERNPHNPIHYGTSTPCTTCHKEHQPSKVLCYDCHTFVFENFKP